MFAERGLGSPVAVSFALSFYEIVNKFENRFYQIISMTDAFAKNADINVC